MSSKSKTKYNTKMVIAGLLFVAPALGFSLLFDWYPMFEGIYRSFYRWNGYDVSVFIGFQNFIDIFNDPIFWTSMKNMLFFLVTNLALMFPTILACIVLFRLKSMRAQYVYRVLFCLPMVIPGMVIMLMWQFMYNPQYGLFNNLLALIGLENWQQVWLGDPNLVKWCLVFMGFPFVSTNAALIYLGGLKSIPDTVWEAAALDGVGPIKRFFALEMPLIVGQFKLNLVGCISGTITGYGAQLILTKGGPGFSSTVPGLYMYNSAFKGGKYGYASALSLVLFVMSLIVTAAAMKFIKSEDS